MRERIAAPVAAEPVSTFARASTLLIQRQCACGGSSAMGDECEECKKNRTGLSAGYRIQRADDDEPENGGKTPETAPPEQGPSENVPAPDDAGKEPAEQPPAPQPTATAAGLIVEDNATDLQPGQMPKTDFLSQLREAVCARAEDALAGTGRSAKGCPYLDYWFKYYGTQDAATLESGLLQYVPDASGASSAADYIPVAAERVRQGIAKWVSTGEIDAPDAALAAQAPEPTATGTESSTLAVRLEHAILRSSRVLFKALPGGARQPADPRTVQQQLGSGTSLPDGVRARMEPAFGHDFSRVRVHADEDAGRLSSGLNAHAFTIGNHIAFAAGTYRPGTLPGDALIAHELAHVVQQEGAQPGSGPAQAYDSEYHALEEDADRASAGVIGSLWTGAMGIARDALPRVRSGLSLQRCTCDKAKDTIPSGVIADQTPDIDCSKITAEPLDKMRAHPGATPGQLGLTHPVVSSGGATWSGGKGGCQLTWDKRPSINLDIYAFTEKGTYDDGTEVPTSGHCKGKTVKRQLVVDQAISDKAKEGEMEHCQDNKIAYAKSWGRREVFYDELTGGFCPSTTCTDELNTRFKSRMGLERSEFDGAGLCFFNKSKERDTNKWHDFLIDERHHVYASDCSTVTNKVDFSSTTKVPGTKPEDLVKDCPAKKTP
jgi:hypothetical protein